MIAVVRHQQAAKELVDLGTTDMINSSDEDVSVAVKKITNGTGVDYAIDSIGGEHGTTLATCVKNNGHFFLLGLLSGKQIDWSYVAALPISTKIFHLRHWLDEATYSQKELAFQQLFDLVLSHQLHISSFGRVPSYKSFKTVLQEIETKQVSGKQCLVFD
ncbi:zinc-binding dehydrogenase [uncultured Enterococcus sp.]|uniref:zinc-binding dehydrogenase n=1 Tax=uncultured Enterococcus sp. TaxID=167972 RepID=UPI00259A57B4|nr:zinc-binding dehydrogenase [uncultured Enterococcus sp.]